uniref:Pre-mRNA-splicing factor PRP46 n=1 Tax=Blastobotrys adeninivorans TaxID=409370 RepID=A0A060TCD3_BLAAD
MFSARALDAAVSFEDEPSNVLREKRKLMEYESVASLPEYLEKKMQKHSSKKSILPKKQKSAVAVDGVKMITGPEAENSLVKAQPGPRIGAAGMFGADSGIVGAPLARPTPAWHAPWKLMRVISGHQGWVRSVCVEPDNQWFATGSADKTIKIWDLASGTLKLTLTGHIMAVRGLAVSPRHPYLFSAGEDKMVKCWDLEHNKVVRHYHGHLSAVYGLDLHPNLDLIVTSGRDAVVRVWDMRTRHAVHVLSGHKAAVSSVKCQEADPQIISGSADATVRLWDLAAGKTRAVLTHHKKSVRALAVHPEEFTFASASPDNIKQWKCPEGAFIHNFGPSQNSIVNTLSVNADGVMFAGGDNGTMGFYDWKSGHKFQQMETTPLPGSLESESGIFASTFDHTGLRLITCEADKSIKVWREDPEATPDSHPGIPFDPRSSY